MLEPGHGAIVILQDLSERKRWEEAQAGLRRDQALAEVSAVLAHEIRNPLGSLELFAGLLAEAEWKGSVASGWSTFRLDCEHWQRR